MRQASCGCQLSTEELTLTWLTPLPLLLRLRQLNHYFTSSTFWCWPWSLLPLLVLVGGHNARNCKAFQHSVATQSWVLRPRHWWQILRSLEGSLGFGPHRPQGIFACIDGKDCEKHCEKDPWRVPWASALIGPRGFSSALMAKTVKNTVKKML